MLDRDLAELYGVKAKVSNHAVKRNKERFPGDFMFQLSKREAYTLVSHFAIPLKRSFGGKMPHAFTEQGVVGFNNLFEIFSEKRRSP